VVAAGTAPVPATRAALEIAGLGFGHGRGMGQWGAFGYSTLYGWGYKQILSHYYGGARLGRLSSEPEVTVALSEAAPGLLRAEALGGGELVVSLPGTGGVHAPAIEVVNTDGKNAIYTGPGCQGPWKLSAEGTAAVTVASAAGQAGPYAAAAMGASMVDLCLPAVGYRIYQGDVVAQTGGLVDNVVPLEEYLDGVVPAESPPVWGVAGGEAALEAQAVAARSYAVASIRADGAICDTALCQVYEGWPVPYGPTADQAVQATAGQALFCRAASACGPAGSVALAEYSASSGGYTAGGMFPAVPDLGDAVAANPEHSWVTEVPATRLDKMFPSIGTFLRAVVTRRNGLGQWGGRAEEVLLLGVDGQVELSGDQLASDLGLHSDWFKFYAEPPTTPSTTTTSTASPSSTSPSSTTSTAGTTTSTLATSTATSSTTATSPTASASSTTTTEAPATTAPTVTAAALGAGTGCWATGPGGDVSASGAAELYGTAAGTSLAGQVVAMATAPGGRGYWLAARDGAVLGFGDAHWYGSALGTRPASPVVAMAATRSGRGYWLVEKDGAVLAFGDAAFYGSAAYTGPSPGPPVDIAAMAPTPDDGGYWLVSGDGGLFFYGDAQFFGSPGGQSLRSPATAMAVGAGGRGYYVLGQDGDISGFGPAAAAAARARLPGGTTVTATAMAVAHGAYFVATTSGRVYKYQPGKVASFVGTLPSPTVAIACYG
jgi:SpoIID/LytB domain protein